MLGWVWLARSDSCVILKRSSKSCFVPNINARKLQGRYTTGRLSISRTKYTHGNVGKNCIALVHTRLAGLSRNFTGLCESIMIRKGNYVQYHGRQQTWNPHTKLIILLWNVSVYRYLDWFHNQQSMPPYHELGKRFNIESAAVRLKQSSATIDECKTFTGSGTLNVYVIMVHELDRLIVILFHALHSQSFSPQKHIRHNICGYTHSRNITLRVRVVADLFSMARKKS